VWGVKCWSKSATLMFGAGGLLLHPRGTSGQWLGEEFVSADSSGPTIKIRCSNGRITLDLSRAPSLRQRRGERSGGGLKVTGEPLYNRLVPGQQAGRGFVQVNPPGNVAHSRQPAKTHVIIHVQQIKPTGNVFTLRCCLLMESVEVTPAFGIGGNALFTML